MGVKDSVGTRVTKLFGIDTDPHRQEREHLQTVGRDTVGDAFIEEDPDVKEWLAGLAPSAHDVSDYFISLFPSAQWLRRYNLHWMLGDVIAGITVGLVVVPQALAYAVLARLPPAFGLYTSFTGAVLYFLFGTSKDIVIGTTAVGSLLIGGVVAKVEEERPGVYKPEEAAHALSFLAGLTLLALGLFRLGWLIEFIPYMPINAFVTSASITIMSTQIPVALGIKGINTREAPIFVLLNTIKGLPRSQLDAAIGLTSIALLFAIRDVCAKMELRQPQQKRTWAMISSLRLTFTVLFFTFISWLVHRSLPEGVTRFRIVGHIDKGFTNAGIPKMDTELFGLVASELPAICVILIVEHIAIAKSFGRIFGYQVIPSQEILAQGAANVLSPFVGGYTCTGSFGASAVLSKAGVRTPLAGLFSALILILALYALTAVFYFIPNAALAGLIIHATCNLVTPPKSLYKYWKLSPLELIIWVIGVALALFTSLETSIYTTVGLSFAILFIRMARKPGKFSGRSKVTKVVKEERYGGKPRSISSSMIGSAAEKERDVFLAEAENKKSAHNPAVKVEPVYPGVFIYRFAENFNYVNQANNMDHLLQHILKRTQRTCSDDGVPLKDRLWSDPPPPPKSVDGGPGLPHLRAIILDFSAVNIIDITSIQGLIDLRNTLDKYAAPAIVEWHFAGVHNRWTRRALAYAGFGYPSIKNLDNLGNWCPAYTVATSMAGATAEDRRERGLAELTLQSKDEERRWSNMAPILSPVSAISKMTFSTDSTKTVDSQKTLQGDTKEVKALQGEGRKISGTFERNAPAVSVRERGVMKMDTVYGIDRPFFHIDLTDAVDTAVRNARKADEFERIAAERSERSETNSLAGSTRS